VHRIRLSIMLWTNLLCRRKRRNELGRLSTATRPPDTSPERVESRPFLFTRHAYAFVRSFIAWRYDDDNDTREIMANRVLTFLLSSRRINRKRFRSTVFLRVHVVSIVFPVERYTRSGRPFRRTASRPFFFRPVSDCYVSVGSASRQQRWLLFR